MIDLLLQTRFGQDEQGNALLTAGWDKPEPGFAWSNAPESRIRLPPSPATGRVVVELTLAPFTHAPRLPSQRLNIAVGNEPIAARRLAWQTTLRLDIPAETRRRHAGKSLILTLHHPDATSPLEIGAGPDTRTLGIRVMALTMLHMAARTLPPPPAGPRTATTFRFGANEETAPMLIEGFGAPETDFVWAVGHHSVFRIPASPAPTTLILELNPYIDPPTLRQRVAIGANDHLLGFVALTRRTTLGFALPPPPPGASHIDITLDNLDAAAPRQTGLYADGRPFAVMLCNARLVTGPVAAPAASPPTLPIPGTLPDGTLPDTTLPDGTLPDTTMADGTLPDTTLADGTRQAAIETLTGQTAANIAENFESLGFACELGLLQRRLGQEPSGLLRFSGMNTPCLIEGILNSFYALGRPDTMKLYRRNDWGCGYWVEEQAYELGFQTPLSSLDIPEQAVLRQLARALPFLVRKFFEDAAAAEKIFVFQRRDETTRPEAEAVLAALSTWGDVTILWVQQDNSRAGTVERLGARLLHGYVDNTGDNASGSHECWIGMLANAWLLARRGQAPAQNHASHGVSPRPSGPPAPSGPPGAHPVFMGSPPS